MLYLLKQKQATNSCQTVLYALLHVAKDGHYSILHNWALSL